MLFIYIISCFETVAALLQSKRLGMKKKFLPAELREWGNRWMIIFHQVDPSNNKRVRFARSFELNRIKSKKERRKRAKEIVQELNDSWLPQGYPFTEPVILSSLESVNIKDAILIASKLKGTDRKATTSAYIYTANTFISFLNETKRGGLSISQLDNRIALAFLDWIIIDRKLSNVSHNNMGSKMRAMVEVLKEREYIRHNPFNKFTKLREEEKERRPMTQKEKEIISNAIRIKDKQLYLAVNILYYCFIRKSEMLRLKFRHFDFEHSVIRIPGEKSKNRKSEIVTIPEHLTEMMVKDYNFKKYPGHWLVFGKRMKPNASESCSKNTPTMRHRKIVDELGKKGLIADYKQIVFYSWKDTGANNMLESGIDIRVIQKQIRHSSLETTQRYLKKFNDTIFEIKGMDGDI